MTKIFVGNLPPAATEEEVRELFEEYGEVGNIEMVINRKTGEPRGFAFVNMSDDADIDYAIDMLHMSDFGGRSDMGGKTLNVARARPKRE